MSGDPDVTFDGDTLHIVLHGLAALIPGTVVTVTVTTPEQAPAPPEPPAPAKQPRYMNQSTAE